MRRVHALHAVHPPGIKTDIRNVAGLSVRMRMNHQPARLMNQPVLLLHRRRPDLRMRLHPCRVYTIDQKFRAVVSGLISVENIQPDLRAFLSRLKIPLLEGVHPLLPGHTSVNCRIAAPVMIRHEDSGVAVFFTGSCHFRSGTLRTGTGLCRMQMCLI